MADDANEEGKAKALKCYKIIAGIQGTLGLGMLICGIIATLNIDEDIYGPPYFVGGYVVGIMSLMASVICTCVIMKAPDANSDVKKQELGCVIRGHYNVSMLMIMGCFIGTVLTGLGGFGFENDRSEINEVLAYVIIIGCISGVVITIGSLCIMCTYGTYFGVSLAQRRRGRMMNVNTNTIGGTEFDGIDTNQVLFQSDPEASAMSAQISQLERQNQLLQQQLDLQQQLNEQQQQQQQQYGGGFSQPPPPPMYGTGPAYPPTAPPPSYNDVK